MRWFQRAGMSLALVAAFFGTTIATAPSASAAVKTGWVYVVVNDSVCGTSGTKVRDVLANFSWKGGSSTIKWERDGDNVVYPKVGLNTKVTYQIKARCFKKIGRIWFTVGYPDIWGSFTPKKHGETIRVP